MRTLTVILIVMFLALPAVAGQTAKIKLDDKHTFTLSVDTKFAPSQPEYMGFTVASEAKQLIEVKGDPMIFIGGVFLGYWPDKHMSFVFRSGVKITGHATSKNGNPQSFEIFHTDGTMTRVTKADTTKPVVKKYGKVYTWAWKKLAKKTVTIHVD
jgi:hypothetical protein